MENTDVVAVFKCTGYRVAESWKGGKVRTIDFVPIADEKGIYKKFYEATPSGKLELGVANDDVSKHFDIGKLYYITISEKQPEGLVVS